MTLLSTSYAHHSLSDVIQLVNTRSLYIVMASFLPDTDSEDELPVGWEERATLDGKVFYAK